MAKGKQDKNLYSRMRDSGVRKKVARQLADLPTQVKGGNRVPKPMREAVERLEGAVSELRRHAGRGDRSAASRKAAKTRRAKAKSRSAAAKKGARTRSKS